MTPAASSASILPRAPNVTDSSRWISRLTVVATTLIFIGLIWDISWHLTIGRDTFWTPAHIVIYLGGALPGVLCGFLAAKTTFFGSPSEKAGSVRLLGAYAPFGAWTTIWGALSMLTAAPFDDWWHNAYGLDVKIISPPHALLFFGGFMVLIGAMLLLLRDINSRAKEAALSNYLFAHGVGVLIGTTSFLFLAEGWPNRQHSIPYYVASCYVYPGLLIVSARCSRLRWGATFSALSYMIIVEAMVLILPLFAAHPKLGPILNPTDHMVPPYFPHLLVIPAVLVDWLNQRAERKPGVMPATTYSLAGGAIFPAIFVPMQWEFSKFLLSPFARNPIFAGGKSISYYSTMGNARYDFWEATNIFNLGDLTHFEIASVVSAAVGIALAQWMRRIVR